MSYNGVLSAYKELIKRTESQDFLAFKQIDEDIQNFKFPSKYLNSERDKNRIRTLELKCIRRILRAITYYLKEFEAKQFCYNTGTLQIIQKILATSGQETWEQREEESFWIMLGLV